MVDPDRAARGQADGVEMPRQGRFARAIVSEHRDELPASDFQINPVQGDDRAALIVLIIVGNLLCFDNFRHCEPLFMNRR